MINDESHEAKDELFIVDVVESEKVRTYTFDNGGQLASLTKVIFLEDTLDYELPDAEENTAVVAKDFKFPFCLAGGYKHCGPGCGDGKNMVEGLLKTS